jgi:hypothetical protein
MPGLPAQSSANLRRQPATAARDAFATLNGASQLQNNDRMTGKVLRFTIVAAMALCANLAAAHHSAALFYDLNGNVEVSGTVTEFRFANPHAILKFDVIGDDGEVQHWTAETTSPSVLRRRGWSQDSFKPGEKVTLQGLPSVDGSYLIRITRAFRGDGSEVGVPRGTDN